MRKYIFILLTGVIALTLSCKKHSNSVELELSLEKFDSLVLESAFEIELVQSTENKLIVQGHQKWADAVHASVSNNTLSIELKAKDRWLYPDKSKVKLILHTDGIARIQGNESCQLFCRNELTAEELVYIAASKYQEAEFKLNCQRFATWNNFPCGGKVSLSGQCTSVSVWNYALMQVDASQLQKQNFYIENYSKGDVIVGSGANLSYGIFGSGNIYYTGFSSFIEVAPKTGSGELLLQ